MYLSKLKLVNQNGLVLQDVKFHDGINFVVDAEASAHHNKVGKTTFLRLIDIAMGAKDRSGLYVDPSTNSTNSLLEHYIESNHTRLEVTLVDQLVSPKVTHVLQVGLYKGGRYHINGAKTSQVEYRRQLKALLFNSKEPKPTFRELINSFVRISMTGDSDAFLHNLPRASTATFRAVYNFLFDISDPSLDQRRGDLAKQLRAVVDGEKQFKHLQNVQDADQISQILATLKSERNRIQQSLDDIVSLHEFEAHRQQWQQARAQYQKLTTELSEVQYQLDHNQELQDQVIADAQSDVDKDLTQTFFDEVKKLVPSVDKSFDELVTFNQQLYANKLRYLKSVRKGILAQQTDLIAQRNAITQDNEILLTLVEEDKLSEYTELSRRLGNRNAEITQQEQLLQQMQNYASEKATLQAEIDGLKIQAKANITDYSHKMTVFNQYFTEFAHRINGERPMLTYVPDVDNFPLRITDLTGSSTGTRKSLIAAFDVAYQCFAANEDKAVPKFVVHDLIETVEGDNVKTTVEIANENHVQYIVAVLKEKLTSSGFSDQEQKAYSVIELSMDQRLFDEPKN